MSTRCNVLFEVPEIGLSIYIYRHHDGYPEETGVDLLGMAVEAKDAEAFLTLILGSKAYELTNGVHGDIQHFYVLRFTKRGVSFGHAERNTFEEKCEAVETLAKAMHHTAHCFQQDVLNPAIEAMNVRCRERQLPEQELCGLVEPNALWDW